MKGDRGMEAIIKHVRSSLIMLVGDTPSCWRTTSFGVRCHCIMYSRVCMVVFRSVRRICTRKRIEKHMQMTVHVECVCVCIPRTFVHSHAAFVVCYFIDPTALPKIKEKKHSAHMQGHHRTKIKRELTDREIQRYTST